MLNSTYQASIQVQVVCDKIRQILTGEESTKPYHEFLRRNNQMDILILKTTKVCSPIRCKVTHPSNSRRMLLSQGPWFTTPSSPLRMHLCNAGYLPLRQSRMARSGSKPSESNVPGATYSEGGALYALGTSAECGSDVILSVLKSAQKEVV